MLPPRYRLNVGTKPTAARRHREMELDDLLGKALSA
jgi:hypothetical protein